MTFRWTYPLRFSAHSPRLLLVRTRLNIIVASKSLTSAPIANLRPQAAPPSGLGEAQRHMLIFHVYPSQRIRTNHCGALSIHRLPPEKYGIILFIQPFPSYTVLIIAHNTTAIRPIISTSLSAIPYQFR